MRHWVGLCCLLAGGCADIDAWGEGECGNNVVEPEQGEDCDLIADPSLGDDLQCGLPDGSPGECRYLCDGAECPRGWTCADDGICRAHSGEFEDDGEPVVILAAQQIALQDVLGEAEAELVVRLEGDVVVFGTDDATFAPTLQVSVPEPRGDASFGDVDGDELVDILLPAASRTLDAGALPQVHVLRSDGERMATAVVPQRLAPDRLAAVVAAPGDASAAEVLVQVQRRDTGLTAHVEPSNCLAAPASATLTLGGATEAEVPFPAAARLFVDGRPHVAIATVGSVAVELVAVERMCGAGVCEPRHAGADPCATALVAAQTITMPSPVADAGCRFGDFDGLEGPDLLCNLEGDELAVAFDEAGALSAGEPVAYGGLDDLPAEQTRACAPTRRVLAAADLDGDGDTDLVTPHGIFRREAGATFVRVYARTLGDAWAEAVVADVDGDGGPEVIVTVAQASEDCAPVRMQALVETDGAYAAELVRDVGLPRDLRQGDFDGDGIDDLATVEPGPEDTRVAVLFGDSKEPLEDVTSVGGFDSVSALAAVRSRDGTEINEDLVGDLAIVSEDGEFLTMVTGSTTRTLLSPLTFDPAGAEIGRRAAQTLVGSLLPHPAPDDDEDAVPPDVFAIADTRAWLLRDDDVHHGDEPVAVDLSGTGIRASCAVWSIGPARADEASVWAGVDGRAPRVTGVVDDCDLSVAPTIVVARFAGSRAEPRLQVSTGSLGDDALRPTTIEVFDLDGTGVDDVLVHTSHVGDTRRGNVWLMLNPEPGAGDLHAISPLTDGDVVAARAINADADETLELAVLTTTGLFILDAVEPDSFESFGPVLDLPRAPVGDEWASLVTGDFDGNDLFDLGLLVGDAVYLYPAIERE